MSSGSLHKWGITYQILVVTITVSAVIWFVISGYQSRQLQQIFFDKAQQELNIGAADDRLLFDQYSQAFFRSVKLIAGQKSFYDYVEKMQSSDSANGVQVSHLSQLPSWMPRPSVMRTFYRARYALLFDGEGHLHSAYHHTAEHRGEEGIPQEMLNANSVLRKLSHNQAYLTMIAETPYLLTSERVKTPSGYVTLALVSPIDNAFLVEAASSQRHSTIITLIDKGGDVVASSDVEVIPVGSNTEKLSQNFIMVRKSFFDYGASDLSLEFTSFASLAEVNNTIADVLVVNNYQRATITLVMMVTFTLIVLFFVRRVIALGGRVSQLSLEVLNRRLDKERGGDELDILSSQIDSFAREIIDSRDKLNAEVTSATRIAEELEQRTYSLDLMNRNLENEIAERKRGESEREVLSLQLQQAQRMDAIGKITGGVAHDFNNILASILGFSTLAQMKFAKLDEAGVLRQYLAEIVTAGERGRDLVASMMAFSRGESGEKKVVALDDEVRGIVAMLRPTISSSIDINVIIKDDICAINIDPVGLQQTIINLVVNARDGMLQEKGVIEITLERVRLAPKLCNSCHERIEGEFLELRVSDSGVGISKEHVAHIFEPFFTTKEVGKGSGMGLSVIHGFLHANDGHVLVESTLGKGTAFRLLLKPSDGGLSVTSPEVPVDSESETVTSARIMVVDDEPALTGYLQDLLELKGYQVVLFNDPLEAFDYYTKSADSIDLMITDQTMPQLTGIELTERVLSLNPQLPVVMCTGYSATTNEELAKARGVSEYMTKPIDSRQLFCAIERLLNKT